MRVYQKTPTIIHKLFDYFPNTDPQGKAIPTLSLKEKNHLSPPFTPLIITTIFKYNHS